MIEMPRHLAVSKVGVDIVCAKRRLSLTGPEPAEEPRDINADRIHGRDEQQGQEQGKYDRKTERHDHGLEELCLG